MIICVYHVKFMFCLMGCAVFKIFLYDNDDLGGIL